MADVLSDTQIGEIIDAFNAVDTDNDGVITSGNMGKVLKLLGENPTDAELQVRSFLRDALIKKRWDENNFTCATWCVCIFAMHQASFFLPPAAMIIGKTKRIARPNLRQKTSNCTLRGVVVVI